jgi:flagellar basal-body rod modification protein FlgD
MTNITNVNTTDPLANYRLENQEVEQKDGGDLGKNEFLELMIAQLENQNPLEPQDNGAFISQLAEFSALEEMQQVNTTVQSFATSFQSSQALQASAMVGRSVLVPSSQAPTDEDGQISGLVDVPASTGRLTLSIMSPSGELVRQIEMGQQIAGTIPFTWDGLNQEGEAMPQDRYTIVAEAQNGSDTEQLDTLLSSQVNSVSIANSGDITLNLAGIGGVPLENVREIN